MQRVPESKLMDDNSTVVFDSHTKHRLDVIGFFMFYD